MKFIDELSALSEKKWRHCLMLGSHAPKSPAQLQNGESWESPGYHLSQQTQSCVASPGRCRERDPDLFAQPKLLNSPSSRGAVFQHLFAFRRADLESDIKGKSESSGLCAWCPLL